MGCHRECFFKRIERGGPVPHIRGSPYDRMCCVDQRKTPVTVLLSLVARSLEHCSVAHFAALIGCVEARRPLVRAECQLATHQSGTAQTLEDIELCLLYSRQDRPAVVPCTIIPCTTKPPLDEHGMGWKAISRRLDRETHLVLRFYP